MKPIPIPAKYLYPYVGSWVLRGQGWGQPKMTLGLPVLITTSEFPHSMSLAVSSSSIAKTSDERRVVLSSLSVLIYLGRVTMLAVVLGSPVPRLKKD